jgi:hydroxypyruvate reductase
MDARALLIESFHAAVGAADARKILPPHLPQPPAGKTLVVGAGKAAAAMALAVEQHWPSAAPLTGLVITRYQHGLLTNRIKVVEAGHPVPDESGERAAQEILRRAKALGANDLLLALLSGGGSSLLSLPVESISMDELKATTKDLLRCGAPIQDMNTVRKHLSGIQGGKLAAACRARVLALIISDVTGDDPTHIGSGPCAPDPSTYQDAQDIIARYGVDAPAPVVAHLQRGARGEIAETPKPGDKLFRRVENRIIATAQGSLQAAAAYLRAQGITPMVLGDSVTGEASEVAKVYAALVRQIRGHGEPFKPPVALISGGECTVTVRGNGRGGRCTEFLLSLALELDGMANVHALACDTDGIDGSEDNAGAVLAPDALARAAAASVSAKKLLANNDGYSFFEGLNDLVVTGPTRTNVNDFRAILVL